jgi:hypothetical protein
VTLNGAVDNVVDGLADELDPQPESTAARQLNAIATVRVRLDWVKRPIGNIARRQDWMNASRSGLIVSAWVVGIP